LERSDFSEPDANPAYLQKRVDESMVKAAIATDDEELAAHLGLAALYWLKLAHLCDGPDGGAGTISARAGASRRGSANVWMRSCQNQFSTPDAAQTVPGMGHKSAELRIWEWPDAPKDHLHLRELRLQCSNDSQIVIGLLAIQKRRMRSKEAVVALTDTMESVSVLARSHGLLHHHDRPTLEAALQQLCAALQAPIGPRNILIALTVSGGGGELSQQHIAAVTLTVHELISNAIQHAFKDEGGGIVRIKVEDHDPMSVAISVDDDGHPFAKTLDANRAGLGLDMARRLVSSVGGLLISPASGSKSFQMRIPRALPANPHLCP
jgi:two-component sensor histidine kinase